MKTTRVWAPYLIGLCVLSIAWFLYDFRRSVDQKRSAARSYHSVNTNEFTKAYVLNVVSRIHTNMTFAEIATIVPVSANDTPRQLTHGGITYFVPIGGSVVELRFQYPKGSYSTNKASPDSVLNHDPIVQ